MGLGGVLRTIGRGVGALGRGAAYLRRQRFGFTPEYEQAMRDEYLRALRQDEEERSWKREEVIGRQEDRRLRRDELEANKADRKDREAIAAAGRALELLPGMLNADMGPVAPPDIGQIGRLTGADEPTVRDAISATERRLSGERASRGAEEKRKKETEAERDARELRQEVERLGRQKQAQIETHKTLTEYDESRPKKTPELTFEDALRIAPTVNAQTGMPLSTDERAEEARRLVGYARAQAHPEDADLFMPEPRSAPAAAPGAAIPEMVKFQGKIVPFKSLPPEAQALVRQRLGL